VEDKVKLHYWENLYPLSDLFSVESVAILGLGVGRLLEGVLCLEKVVG